MHHKIKQEWLDYSVTIPGSQRQVVLRFAPLWMYESLLRVYPLYFEAIEETITQEAIPVEDNDLPE